MSVDRAGSCCTHMTGTCSAVPGGGFSPDHTLWIACPPGFLLSVRALSSCFRDLFLQQLRAAFARGELSLSGAFSALAAPASFAARLDALAQIDWVASTPNPHSPDPTRCSTISAATSHRVAIANSRLVGLDNGQVSFTWKGLSSGRQNQGDDALRRRVAARRAGRISSHPPHRLPGQPPSRNKAGPLPRSARRTTAAPLAGSPPQPYRRGDRCLPVLRRPDADWRTVAANSTATPTQVVRQFMTLSPSLPLRSAALGNVDHGASECVSRAPFSLASRSAGVAKVGTRPINRLPQSQSTRPYSHRAALVLPTRRQRSWSI